MAVDEKKLEAALASIAQGGPARERGVTLLDDLMGGMLERYFLRNKVRPDDAEEMVWGDRVGHQHRNGCPVCKLPRHEA